MDRSRAFVGAGACQACHPKEHASFQRTYHRTMTRVVRDVAFDGEMGPKLPVTLSAFGREFQLSKGSHGVLYRGPDLHAVGRALPALAVEVEASDAWKQARVRELFSLSEEVTSDVALVTGSHHYLAFWITGGAERELRQLPFVYLLSKRVWLPRDEVFLQPAEATPHIARWNANCIQCHTVGGRPEQTEIRDEATGVLQEFYRTSVADLGITCEACHGPGRKHILRYQDPLARRAARTEPHADDLFVPRAEGGDLASAACGQCHSYFLPRDPESWWTSGFSENFAAGEPLSDSRILLEPPPQSHLAGADGGATLTEGQAAFSHLSRDAQSVFWEDGSIIVGGREYNALLASPCYKNGQGERKLQCTSCHSMHSGDRADQLNPELPGNALCTQCHDQILPSHTGHAPDSVGSKCVNCHMPKTSYALLKGIASHQISSPGRDLTRPPQACSLCHVDQTSAWLRRSLTELFPNSSAAGEDESPAAALKEPESLSDLPLAFSQALAGNAAERAIYAYAFGTEEARRTAGTAVLQAALPYLKRDPYAAVRLIATDAEERVNRAAPAPAPGAVTAPIGSAAQIKLLLELRDSTPVTISE